MYTVSTSIEGIAPLLQHRFPVPDIGTMSKGGARSTGSKDYTEEWRDYLYADNARQVYQPSTHIEGALIRAASSFKIAGKRGKTYKDLFQSSIFIDPQAIPHEGINIPDELDTDADKPLYLDVRPVVIQRARIVRIRPCFKAGWKLAFEIQVIDDEIQPGLLNDVLTLAGRTVGIGDYRPRFGRFMVTNFAVHK